MSGFSYISFVNLFWVLSMSMSAAEPSPVACTEDDHCAEGFYCAVTHFCNKCVECGELNRESLLPSSVCTVSANECGVCLHDLVLAHSGPLKGTCIIEGPPVSFFKTFPGYIWIFLIIGLITCGVITCYIVYKMNIFQYTYTTNATIESAETPPPTYEECSNLQPASSQQDIIQMHTLNVRAKDFGGTTENASTQTVRDCDPLCHMCECTKSETHYTPNLDLPENRGADVIRITAPPNDTSLTSNVPVEIENVVSSRGVSSAPLDLPPKPEIAAECANNDRNEGGSS